MQLSLSINEKNALIECEHIIERGMKSFIEVGTALLAIRDNRLYRETHTTFEDYCQERWALNRNYANKLIAAATVIDDLGTNVPILPANEAQARPLTRVEPELRSELWQTALETAPNGKVTAAHVEKVVEERRNSTVTYHHQPGIHASRGSVPLAGTSHIYTVNKLLWPGAIEELLKSLLSGVSLHLCCGMSRLGDVRLDNDPKHEPDIVADAAYTELEKQSFDTVLCDPPYNGVMRWNHDLLAEIARLARRRIIFQHWFIPANKDGLYKKSHRFHLSNIYVWQPKTYFGRAQLISVFDRE